VLEEKKKHENDTADAAFYGLPVTMSSICIALAYCSNFVLPSNIFIVVMHVVTVLVAFLFILNFRIEKKPSLKSLILLIVLVSAFVIGTIMYNTLGA
jgi:phosphatidylserine synthase